MMSRNRIPFIFDYFHSIYLSLHFYFVLLQNLRAKIRKEILKISIINVKGNFFQDMGEQKRKTCSIN